MYVYLLQEKVDLGSSVLGVYADPKVAQDEADRLNAEAVQRYTIHHAKDFWVETWEVE